MGHRASKNGTEQAAEDHSTSESGRKSNWEVIEHYSKSGFHSGSVRSRAGAVGELTEQVLAPPAVASAPHRSLCSSCLRVFRSHRFADVQVETLYQRYFMRMNQSSLTSLLGILMLVLVSLGVLDYMLRDSGGTRVLLVVLACLLVLYASLAVILARARLLRSLLLVVFSVIIAVSFFALVASSVATAAGAAPTEGVWQAVFCVYMGYALLPLRLREALLSGLLLSVLHLALAGHTGKEHPALLRLVSPPPSSVRWFNGKAKCLGRLAK